MAPTFDAVSLVVIDMPATLAFYRRLGMELPADADKEPHVEVTVPGGMRLCWDLVSTVTSIDPGWTPPSGGHRAALAFGCADPTEVDRTYADLVASGAPGHLEPFDAFWGQRYATVLDPDGNAVDLYANLPA